MSNLIFPTFTPNLGGPTWPVKKTPSFKTIIQTPANNRGENRISLTPFPIWKFELDFNYLSGDFSQNASALAQLAGFFGKVGGAAQDWLYSDPYDNSVPSSSPSIFGYGDGSTLQFPLVRQVGGMNDLIQNLNGNPTIYVNGVAQNQLGFGGGSANPFIYGNENLLIRSATFATPQWTAARCTVSDNVVISPDGSTDGASITATSTNPTLVQALPVGGLTSFPSGTQLTFSIWLRVASGTLTVPCYIEGLPMGVIGQGLFSVTTAWQRFSITVTLPFAASNLVVQIGVGSAWTTSGTVLYPWGPQFERGASASGYVISGLSQIFPNGLIQFIGGSAPPADSVLSWSGNFYFRCRFEEDEWSDLQEFLYQYWEQSSLKFRSVLL